MLLGTRAPAVAMGLGSRLLVRNRPSSFIPLLRQPLRTQCRAWERAVPACSRLWDVATRSGPTSRHYSKEADSQKKADAAKQPTTPTASSSQTPAVPGALHEDIYNLPNFLTFTRIVAAPAIGYFILHDYNVWAVSLLAYAGVTDLLDGWIARKWDRKTVVGTVIDPMADKALMTILTVCLAVKGALPIWVAGIILGRDVGLAIAAIYYRWISLPPPKTFARYWDFSLPSAEVHPTTISKYNTLFQLALVGITTAAPVIPADLTGALTIMQYIVAATTVWSGASYVYTKDAVKILNAPTNKAKK